ncbi:sensor domain-containing diguanylate cyclase [Granulicella sp. L46]|uniref:GGDEF domain-containing protein n=1 Tax=Granulicella sp. L46 TaxID=1641865 RepID=UPI00131A6C6E|nr:sensor domain-containing diguanylate cyclase [Granulicella sp. L46]
MPMNGTDFQFLAENSTDVICRAGIDRVLHYVSPSCATLLGCERGELEGKIVDAHVFPEDMPKVIAAVQRSLAPGVIEEGATIRMRRRDNTLVWTEVNARVIRDDVTGEALEFVLVMRDVTERKLLEEKLSMLAMTDGLTGVANRRAFDEALEREWKLTLRYGTQVSLLLLDIDHFKPFNDQYGHQVGDDCLRAVAQAAAGAVRATDIVARYGGEEIAMILPQVDVAGAWETAEKVRSVIEGLRVPHDGNPEGGGWVTVSIGAATALARVGGTMQMPEGLLQAADHALYKAKHGGRNRVAGGILLAPQQLAIVA